MNLKNNKGYTGIDISIAMIIILIFIPTIFGIVYNMQKIRARTEREATAIHIATDVLEIARGLDYSKVMITAEPSEQNHFQPKLEEKYTTSEFNSSIDDEPSENDSYEYAYYTYTGTENKKEHYRIQVGVMKYYPTGVEPTNENDYVKKVKVKVTYPSGNSTKSIDISTILQNNE